MFGRAVQNTIVDADNGASLFPRRRQGRVLFKRTAADRQFTAVYLNGISPFRTKISARNAQIFPIGHRLIITANADSVFDHGKRASLHRHITAVGINAICGIQAEIGVIFASPNVHVSRLHGNRRIIGFGRRGALHRIISVNHRSVPVFLINIVIIRAPVLRADNEFGILLLRRVIQIGIVGNVGIGGNARFIIHPRLSRRKPGHGNSLRPENIFSALLDVEFRRDSPCVRTVFGFSRAALELSARNGESSAADLQHAADRIVKRARPFLRTIHDRETDTVLNVENRFAVVPDNFMPVEVNDQIHADVGNAGRDDDFLRRFIVYDNIGVTVFNRADKFVHIFDVDLIGHNIFNVVAIISVRRSGLF